MKKILFVLLLGIAFLHYGFVDTLDVSIPTGADDPTEGDNRVRELKRAFVERLAVDHTMTAVGNTYDGGTVGYHKKLTLPEQASDPGNVANTVILYSKNDGTESSLYIEDESGGVKQLTQGDNLQLLLDEEAAVQATAANQGQLLTMDSGTQTELYFKEESDGDLVQLTSNGTLNTDFVQLIFAESATYATQSNGNRAAFDDSAPTYAEGYTVVTAEITPVDATNLLTLRGVVYATGSTAGDHLVAHIHNGTTAAPVTGCVGTTTLYAGTSCITPVYVECQVAAGGTTEITYNLQISHSDNNAMYINGADGGRKYGGAMSSTLTITETKA